MHEIPRQEYWSGLPLPSPGDLPNPGIKHMGGRFFTVFRLLASNSSFLTFFVNSKMSIRNGVGQVKITVHYPSMLFLGYLSGK